MSSAEITLLLEEHGIKPTSNRILIARALEECARPVSMTELEDIVQTVDKSNIFRALNAFKEHHLVHIIEDGSDGVRYEICRSHHHDDEEDEDLHVHFHCEVCNKTFCLTDVHIPSVEVPDGYQVNSVNYVVKGVCPECAKHNG